jgi:hypothetical protein
METTDALVNEYPLSGPYEFEGFADTAESLSVLAESMNEGLLAAQNGVGVIREGQNAHGTWGYIFTWDGAKWVHQGYTLEPRSNVGKGPIPLGDFSFNRWMSPKLGKTLRLHNVPGFTDILIHVGNKQGDTQGCILAAKNVDRTTDPTQLVNSRVLTDWHYDTQAQGTVLVRSK